ncbi:hypothetical protein M0Q97_03280, partial [Candidatus Dojkabacteria bacterium]|nr:hypothetical protein [Candidatus Dojkabacteria bacterium]
DATSTTNASIKIYCESSDECHNGNEFLLYYIDNEFLLHPAVINTNTLTTRYDVLGTTTPVGIVAKYSKLYQDYYNGVINNLDCFYVNNTGSTKVYLKMFIDQNDILTVNFLTSVNPDVSYDVDKDDWDDSLNIIIN